MSMNEPGAAAATETGAATDDGVEPSEVREALTKAFDAAEAEDTPAETITDKGAAGSATTADTDVPAGGTAAAQTATADGKAEGGTTTQTPAKTFVQGEAISAAIVAGEWDKVDTTRPPSSLSVEAKAKFASLDEPLRKEFLRLDANFHKGIEQYKADAGMGRELSQIAAPYAPLLQSTGATPASAFKDALNMAYQLQTNPAAVIQQLAQRYKVQIGQQTAVPEDGAPTQVSPEVLELREKLAKIEGKLSSGEQEQQQALRQSAEEALAKFAADPKNVYFSDVRASMASLIQSGEAKDIQDAYDKACWMNPQVRAAMTQQEIDKREKDRIAEVKRKAADAKRASFDVSGSGATSNGKSELSLREHLEAAFPQ